MRDVIFLLVSQHNFHPKKKHPHYCDTFCCFVCLRKEGGIKKMVVNRAVRRRRRRTTRENFVRTPKYRERKGPLEKLHFLCLFSFIFSPFLTFFVKSSELASSVEKENKIKVPKELFNAFVKRKLFVINCRA
jgi:hypothetical protein